MQQPADRLCQKEKEVEIIQEQILNKQFQESLDSLKQCRETNDNTQSTSNETKQCKTHKHS